MSACMYEQSAQFVGIPHFAHPSAPFRQTAEQAPHDNNNTHNEQQIVVSVECGACSNVISFLLARCVMMNLIMNATMKMRRSASSILF